MTAVREFLRRLWYLAFRDRAARELEEEMRLHRELRAETLRTRGLTGLDAVHAASHRFGNTIIHAERSHAMWGFEPADTFLQDVRYAARRLRQRPGFTIAVAGVLALGIGATTAMFSAVDAVMWRSLPFERPDELVTLRSVSVPFDPGPGRAFPRRPSFDITDVRGMNATFSAVAAYASGGANLSEPERPRRVNVGVVTTNLFATLGVMPARGRSFGEESERAGGAEVVIVSWDLWQRHYGGQDIIGRTLPLNDKPYQVIGIMPKGLSFPGQSDVWLPMTVPNTPAVFELFRGFLPSTTIARVAPGTGLAAANAHLTTRWEQFGASIPREPGRRYTTDGMIEAIRTKGAVTPLHVELAGDRRTALLILFGATVLLLLIACANVTNLLLSYGASRGRELAVRSVLGATRGRVVRQLLTESVMLSLAGAAAGLALAPLLLRVLRGLMPAALAGVAPAHVDLRVLSFAAALGLITGIVFGLWPAFGATRDSAATTMKTGGGHGASAAGARRAQRVLVAAELALAMMLLIGAGLMLRSFERVTRTDTGMDVDRVATLELTFARNSGTSVRVARLDAILENLRAAPGVTAAGAVNDLPLRGPGGIGLSITVDGAPSGANALFPRYIVASEDYFRALGITLRRGRYFTAFDDAKAPPVAIINETMVRSYWPEVDPIGRTFRFPGDSIPVTVVGVVSDVREGGLEQAPDPQIYRPLRAEGTMNAAIVARGTIEPRLLLSTLVRAVRDSDPAQAVYNVRMMDAVVGASVAARRANTILIALFGALGLLLSVLGVYAVTSYAVAQRSREFGIRSALGATGRDLLAQVGSDMVWVTAIGIAAGGSAAWALTRVMQRLLYGVTAHDMNTFIAAPLLLVLAVFIAAAIPARRAARVNPADVLRAD